MGEVVSLDEVRRERRSRRRLWAVHAAMHPVLRWSVNGGNLAHRRRSPSGAATACGQDGVLTLADLDADRCSDCYPAG